MIRPTPNPVRRWRFAAALLACCAPSALGDDPWALLGGLPASVDAAAVIDRPGVRFWQEDAGRMLRAAVSGTGLFSQTERAWAGLSGALGYSEAEAADALLGGRVLVVWEGLARDNGLGAIGAVARADTRWAMVAELDHETARAVRARLKASPRRTTDGRVLYSLDAGRVLMALSDQTARPATDERDRTRVVVAPERAAGLMIELLGGTRAPGAEPHAGSMGEQARAMLGNVEPGWTAVAVLRRPDATGPGVIELRSAGEAWGLRFAAPATTRPAEPGAGAPIGVLDAFRDGVLLAAVFSDAPRFSERGMGMDFRIEADGSARDGPLTAEDGSAMIVRAVPGPGRAGPAIVAQLVMRASSNSAFAESVDRLMSAMIGGEQPPEHRGAFPTAVRTHALPPEPKRAGKAWPGEGARMAWCMDPDADDRSGTISMAMGPEPAEPARAARDAREAWSRLAHDRDPAMVTAGLAHPAALLEAFAPGAPQPVASGARSIERLEWTVRRRDGVVRGELLMRLAPGDARLGGGP